MKNSLRVRVCACTLAFSLLFSGPAYAIFFLPLVTGGLRAFFTSKLATMAVVKATQSAATKELSVDLLLSGSGKFVRFVLPKATGLVVGSTLYEIYNQLDAVSPSGSSLLAQPPSLVNTYFCNFNNMAEKEFLTMLGGMSQVTNIVISKPTRQTGTTFQKNITYNYNGKFTKITCIASVFADKTVTP